MKLVNMSGLDSGAFLAWEFESLRLYYSFFIKLMSASRIS